MELIEWAPLAECVASEIRAGWEQVVVSRFARRAVTVDWKTDAGCRVIS